MAAATATAVSRMPEISGIMSLAEGDSRNADTVLASGYKEQHDQYQRDAIDEYDNAIELSPGYAPAYYGRAIAHEALEEYMLARSNLQRVLELSPDEELKLKAQRKLEELGNK